MREDKTDALSNIFPQIDQHLQSLYETVMAQVHNLQWNHGLYKDRNGFNTIYASFYNPEGIVIRGEDESIDIVITCRDFNGYTKVSADVSWQNRRTLVEMPEVLVPNEGQQLSHTDKALQQISNFINTQSQLIIRELTELRSAASSSAA